MGPPRAPEKAKPPAVSSPAARVWQRFGRYASMGSGGEHRRHSKPHGRSAEKAPVRTARAHSVSKAGLHSPPGFLVSSVRSFAREKEWGEDELSSVTISPAGNEADSESDGPSSVTYFPMKEYLVRPPPREELWFRYNMCLQGEDFDSVRFRRFPFHEDVEQFVLSLLNRSLSGNGRHQGARCQWHFSSCRSEDDILPCWAGWDHHERCQSSDQSPKHRPALPRTSPTKAKLPSHSSSHGLDSRSSLRRAIDWPVKSSEHPENLHLDISTRVRDPDGTACPSTPTEGKGGALWIVDEDDLEAT